MATQLLAGAQLAVSRWLFLGSPAESPSRWFLAHALEGGFFEEVWRLATWPGSAPAEPVVLGVLRWLLLGGG